MTDEFKCQRQPEDVLTTAPSPSGCVAVEMTESGRTVWIALSPEDAERLGNRLISLACDVREAFHDG